MQQRHAKESVEKKNATQSCSGMGTLPVYRLRPEKIVSRNVRYLQGMKMPGRRSTRHINSMAKCP